MTLVYIHGASATGDSFNYIRDQLNHDNDLIIEYDSVNGFENNLKEMQQQLHGLDDIYFITHSLGGIYAVHLAHAIANKVRGAITISAPYGGAEIADFAQYFLPFNRLMQDIGPGSWPIRASNEIKIQHPWTNIVTTRGSSPWIVGANDGVVTINSMRYRSDMHLIELHTNHYEVIMSPAVVDIIRDKIKG